jgi:ribulose-5-phosphate 4-epimerase/fuculose-1-phosphate aldolase
MNEEEARFELAYAYRIADMLGFSDFVFGHISLRYKDGFFIKSPFTPFSKVTPWNLIYCRFDEQETLFSDFGIHRAVLTSHPHLDLNVVLHIHSTAISVIASGQGEFDSANQHAMLVNSSLARHAYKGSLVFEQQLDELVQMAAEHDFVILMNHGFLTADKTLGAALFNAYLFEEACKIQVQLNASDKTVLVPAAAYYPQGAKALLRKYQRSSTLWEELKSCITL